jgi:peptide/nickel transport system substrate-binding protein
MRALRLVAAGAAILAAATAGFAPVAIAQVAAVQAAPLRIALRQDADILDPTLARTYVGRIVFTSLCDKLVDLNVDLQIVPQLATGYEWTDSQTLVLKLRPGVKFHDGTDMDAASVKYSLERHLNMQGSSRRSEIAGVDRIETPDSGTVRIVLKAPNAPFLAQLTDRAGMIVSPKAAEVAGKDFGVRPICAGPYKFVERVPQDRIVLDKFAEYWDAGAYSFPRVVFQPIVDGSVRLANLRAGAIDMSENILPSDVEEARKDPRLKVVVSTALGYQSINFNLGKGPRADTKLGRDARVRKAFELAIDRTALVQVVYNGMFDPTAQAVAPASPFHAKDVKPPARDVARARALLAEAGVKTKLVVTMTLENSQDQRQTGEVLQAMLAEAGIELKLNTMEFASGLDAADRGDFETYLIGWSGRADADGNTWNATHTGAPLNYSGYSNPIVDAALEQARAVTDVSARAALYAKAAARTEEDLPIMYLYHPKNIAVLSSKLSGFVPVPDGMLRLRGVGMSK